MIAAAKRGARALGIEYNPDLVAVSKQNAAKEGVSGKVQFVQADLFESDFTQATVITMFLLPEINLKLRQRILDLKPGTRVVSNTFDMGEWKPDQKASVREGNCESFCTAYLWVVPARVEGSWRLSQGGLTLKQNFQDLYGALKSGAAAASIMEGRMHGEEITFTAGGVQYTGRVNGDTMQGTCSSAGKTTTWSATRLHNSDAAELSTMGFPTEIAVTAKIADTTPPILTSVTYAPTAVNTESGPATVAVTVAATDDLSGVTAIDFGFMLPSGGSVRGVGPGGVSAAQRSRDLESGLCPRL